MSERFKYSTNGVYRCENFAQLLAQDTFPLVQLGTIGGIDEWSIILDEEPIDNDTLAFPFIGCLNNPQLYVNCFFNILGKDGKSIRRTVLNSLHLLDLFGVRGSGINISELLNENNGYLDNGALVIEYGFQVVSIRGEYGIWNFNFNDKLFNPNDSLTLKCMHPKDDLLKVFYGHKQLLRFHSPLFQDHEATFISFYADTALIEVCLQIAHGVRIPLDRSSFKIAYIAYDNELRNVVQYADQQVVYRDWSPKLEFSETQTWASDCALNLPIYVFTSCIELGLRHYLAHLVKHFGSSKDLKDMIQKLDIKTIPGEAMKTFVARIFELGI